MKILLCTNSFEYVVNGPAKFANLILEINQLYPQHQVHILTEDITAERPYVHKVELRFPTLLKPFSQFLRMFVYHRYARKVRKTFPYDVLVYNNAFIGLWSAIVSPQPVVGMINDYNNLSVEFKDYKTDRFWLKKNIFKLLEFIAARLLRAVITNSDYLTSLIIRVYRIPSAKVWRLYKAVDMQKASYISGRNFKMPIQMLFIKADYMCGRIDTLANALGRLNEYTFEMNIIGPEDKFKPEVLSFFSKYSHIRVNFLGRQSQEKVREYMLNCDIFCVPSQREALGVANIEALQAGIPVISTKVGGIPEVLDQGRNGWLVSAGNDEELSVTIKECIENQAERWKKSENGLGFIQKFSKKTMFENFIQLMERCKPV
jgi:colanic acid/amylovoran biosynthesis glycosyltransferase